MFPVWKLIQSIHGADTRTDIAFIYVIAGTSERQPVLPTVHVQSNSAGRGAGL